MKIKVVKQTDKKIKAFQKKEWDALYGKSYDWIPKHFALIAYEGTEVVGALEFHIKGGVAEIASLIIATENRGQGIGTSLFQRAETIARQHHVHKLYLTTGKGWESENFYQNLGMIKTGELPKHWVKKDFVEYTKFI